MHDFLELGAGLRGIFKDEADRLAITRAWGLPRQRERLGQDGIGFIAQLGRDPEDIGPGFRGDASGPAQGQRDGGGAHSCKMGDDTDGRHARRS